jgi:hypothetical protein
VEEPGVVFAERGAGGEEGEEGTADAGAKSDRDAEPADADPSVNRCDEPAGQPYQCCLLCNC